MTSFSFCKLPVTLFAVLISVCSIAQQPAENIIASKKTSDGRYNFIRFDVSRQSKGRNTSQPEQVKTILGLGAKHSFVLNDEANSNPAFKADRQGAAHARYQQYYNGIKVEFGVLTLHNKNGALNILSGDYFNINEGFSTTPVLSEKAALDKAVSFVGAKKYSWEDSSFRKNKMLNSVPKGTLVICKNFIEAAKSASAAPKMELAYKFAVYATEPLRYDYICVSARSGNIILVNPIIKHAEGTGATRYSGAKTIATTQQAGGNYILKDSGGNYNVATYNMNRGTSYDIATNFSDNDNNWTAAEYNNSNYDNAALDAHWGAMKTLDYWRTVHNRNSFDNNGSRINSYVHFANLYSNAFWDGYEMTYGDGNGSTMFPLTSVDICGHEIGHAVCQYTADLIYSNESGAMNEGFSDIWGACIKKYADPSKNTWLTGDEISSTGTPFRSLSNPKSQGQPDTYKGTNWYTGGFDNGGVHYNSGVMNHWFYILTEGKAGTNDKGTAYNVTGIGITKAAQIAYRAENLYLFPAAVYTDARIFTIQAAADLFGDSSNEVIQTAEAWNAVGVADALAKPTNVSAVLSNNNIVVGWSFNTFQAVGGFEVERAVNGTNVFTTIATLGSGARSYTDTGYINNSINQYRIRSFKDALYSDYSDLASIAAGNAPLIMINGSYTTCGNTFLDPGGLGNYNNGSYTTTISPATSGNKLKAVFSQFNVSYDYLYVFNGPTSSSPLLGVFSGTTIPPVLESTAPGGQLTFVFNPSYSNNAPGWQAYISCFRPVAAPSDLAANADSLKNVNLTWRDNANDETRYVIERSLNDSLHFLSLTSLPANSGSYRDTTAPDNSYHYYRVRAYRDSVGSPYSNTVSVLIGNVFIMQNGTISTCGVTFLDPGGSGNYSGGYYTATVSPAISGNKLKIAFSQFNIYYYDNLYIYNGPSSSSPLLGVYSGSTLPPVMESTAPGGELTFVFNPYYSNNFPGWQAYISCFKPVAAPSNLTATADSLKNVNLAWTDNANDEMRYVVERSLNDSLHYLSIISLAANSTGYRDTAAPENSFIYYRVKAYRDSVGSPYSNTASVLNGNVFIMQNGTNLSTCGITFLDPGGLGNYSSGNYTATVSPSVAGNKLKIVFSQFNVNYDYLYIYNGPSSSSPLLGSYYGSALPPVLESSAPGGQLTFVFNPYYSYNNYPGWQAYISCFKPVSKPTNLIAAADTSRRVNLFWRDNADDETRYVVERSANAPSQYALVAQLPANTTQYTDSSAPASSLLFYRVRAYRDTLASFYSDTAKVAFGNAPFLMKDSILITCNKVFMDPGGTDVIPQNTYYYNTATFKPAITGNNVKVVFSKFRLSGYLYVFNGPSANSPLIGSYSGTYSNPLVFEGTGAEGSLTFRYSGYSYSDSGWEAQVSCYKPVVRPTNLIAAADTSRRINLFWRDNSDDETKFVVEKSVNAPSKYAFVAQLPANTTQYTDSAIPANSLIFYRVRAYRDTLASFYSDTARVAFGNAPFLMKDSILITCNKVFMDPGGIDVIPLNNNYYYNIATFKPDITGNNIKAVFSKFRLNGTLYVFNGSSTSSPLIGSFSGYYPNSLVFEGTGAEGSLTFQYQGSSYSDSGWVAQISCYKPVARPTNLIAAADTSQRIKLFWSDNANDETKYVVERSVNAPSNYTILSQLPANTTQYTDSTAPANSYMYYRIRAYRDTLASFYSDTAAVDFGNAPFLMKNGTLITCNKVFLDPGGTDVIPQNIYYYNTATFKPAITGNNIKVVFSSFRLSGYLYVYNGSSTNSPLIGSYSGTYSNPLVFEGTGAEGSLTFQYSGYSYSDSGWVAQVSCYKPVAAPGNLTAYADTLKKVHLSWTDLANDETGYIVERSMNDSLHYSAIASLPANAASYIDTLAPDNSYIFYRVKALRNSVSSPYSNNVSVTNGNLYIMQNGIVSTCGITFLDPGGFGNYNNYLNYTTTFTPSEANKKLKVVFSQFSTESCCDYLRIYNGSSTSSPLLGVFAGSSIPPSFESSAANGALTFQFYSDGSSTSTGWQAYISCFKAVTAPAGLTAYADSLKHVHLSWTDQANDETSYVVERSVNDSVHYLTLASLPANSTGFNDTSASDNSFIYYRVRAFRDTSASNYSNEVSVNIGNVFIMRNGTVSGCDLTFLDPGGYSNYGNSILYTSTLTPSESGKKLRVVFSEFNTESCCDYLRVYNGPNISSPLLGSFLGSGLPPVLESSADNGELTFVFSTDGSVTGSGWVCKVTCITANDTLTTCSTNSNDVNTITSNITGTSYQWQKYNGSTFVNISDNINYTGTTTSALQVKNAGLTVLEKFRCAVNGSLSRERIIIKGNRWTGNVNSNWNNAQNWSCGTVPNAATDVLIEGGRRNYPVIDSNNGECRSLQLLRGAVLNVVPGYNLNIRH